MAILGDQLVASQTDSQIVLSKQTDFLFFSIEIRLEMAEIWPKEAKQLATAIMGDQLVASQIASQIVLIDQTNFLFYPIKIRLEMAEIWPKVAKQLVTAIMGDQLVASQMATQIVLFISFIRYQATNNRFSTGEYYNIYNI